jgi:hypothetical protein
MTVAIGGSVSTRQTLLWVVLLAPAAMLFTFVLGWTDQTMLLVNDRVSTVSFGVPFDWLIQESWLTPPDHLMPYELSPMSPWEFPTTVVWRLFLLDALIFYAFLLAALFTARLVGRQRSRTPPA